MDRCSVCGAPLEGPFCSYCGYRSNSADQIPARNRNQTQQSDSGPQVVYHIYNVQPPAQGYPYSVVYENKSSKSKWVAFTLCFFLGLLGVHRFYVGKVGTGLLWFFTAGVFGFGWLVDLVMILTGDFKDDRNLELKE